MPGMRLPPRRIHLSDTDATGVAYAGRLVDLALQRLEEAMAGAGLEAAAFVNGSAAPVVAHLASDFHRPARLGERLGATVAVTGVGESSAQVAVRLGTAATITVVLVWVDRVSKQSAPWPAAVRRKLVRLG
jgi:acyl-CoA thioesterase FadM